MASVISTINVYAAISTTTDAAHTGSRRSSLARSGWNTIVIERASTTGPTIPAADLSPAITITIAAAPISRVVVRDCFMRVLLGRSVRCPSDSRIPTRCRWRLSPPWMGSVGASRSVGARTKPRSCQPPSPPWQPTRGSKAATSRVSGSSALLT